LRLSRRSFVFGGGAAAAAAASVALAGAALAKRPQALKQATAIPITANPIDRFSVSNPDRTRFGALAFRSGLDLRSSVSGFGGFSGLWRSPDGRDIAALADNAQWLTARLETSDGRLSGLSGAVLAPLLLSNGKPLRKSRYYDTESFAIAGNAVYVGVERNHAVIRLELDGEGTPVGGRPIPVPKEIQDLPGNQGLEAMGIAPLRSPLSGALVAVAERAQPGDAAPTRGFILTGPRQGAFDVVRSEGYDIADLAFLPSGEALLLERRFSILGGFGLRLRRVAAEAIRPGASVDGAVIFESDASHQIDNMEGLAVHREGDETILTLISDNNFNFFQRTIMLEFALVG
jgi:hypothetical protein